MSPIVFGIDIGNGYVKGRQGRRTIFDCPSLVSHAQNVIDFAGFGSSSDFVIEYMGEQWAVGRSATRLSNLAEPIRGRGRMMSNQYKLLFLSALVQLHAKSCEPDSVTVVVPIAWYQKDRQELKQWLSGLHRVGIVKGGRVASVYEYDIHSSVIRIIPEGFATLARETITTEGVAKDKLQLGKSKVGIVNIGTYTTDLIYLDKMNLVPAKCDGRDIGISNAWEELRRYVRSEFERELSDYEVDEVIHRGKFTHNGKSIDVRRKVEQSLTNIAANVEAVINRMWQQGSEADHLLVAGGAGEIFAPYLLDRYPHAQIVDDAFNSEADGAYRYGLLKLQAESA